MLKSASNALAQARAQGAAICRRFGIHCATHQIRLILVSCVVITSLFYPALSIYTASATQGSPALASWYQYTRFPSLGSTNAPAGLDEPTYLWTGYEELRTVESGNVDNACTVRVERLFVDMLSRSTRAREWDDEHDRNASHDSLLLLSTLQLESCIDEALARSDTPCLQSPLPINGQYPFDASNKCFVLTPLSFFHHDARSIRSHDGKVWDALSVSHSADISYSIGGVRITPDKVLSGSSSEDRVMKRPTRLALTYFFPDEHCGSTTGKYSGEKTSNHEPGHEAWLKLLQTAIKDTEFTINGPASRDSSKALNVAVQYNSIRTASSRSSSAISAFVALGYLAFFAYVTWSMRRMSSVHSRIGIAFTGLVEIAVSTITSLSVCALVGFKVTMVPWELLPIVIVYVGAETMFKLVEAVSKTSVTLPVKERIAEGLARAGTSNTLTVVSYNAILGIIAFFSAGAIRQFCAFAVVVLVAHWFLAHTFFLAVLSIDIQRLELDDLLRQNPNLGLEGPGVVAANRSHNKTNTHRGLQTRASKPKPISRWRNFMRSLRNLLKGRATKDLSLFLLLAITATLYYTSSYPPPPLSGVSSSDTGNAAHKPTTSSHARTSRTKDLPNPQFFSSPHFTANSDPNSNAWRIWNVLNPNLKQTTVRLRLEVPTVLVFGETPPSDSSYDQRKTHRQRIRKRTQTIRLVWWALTIVVLPITLTTSALYGLLLYLLKDAELLEAQRNRHPEDKSSEEPEAESLEGQVGFQTLPRAFASDVELISVSGDGKVVASVGISNELVIWHHPPDNTSHYPNLHDMSASIPVRVDTVELLLRSASSSSSAVSAITSLALDGSGSLCAVGTGFGLIAIWMLNHYGGSSNPNVTALPHLRVDNLSAAVVQLEFIAKQPDRYSPPQSQSSSPSEQQPLGWLVAVYENGVVAKWSVGAIPTVSYITAGSISNTDDGSQTNARVVKSLLFRVHTEQRLLVAFCLDNGTVEIRETQDFDPILPTNNEGPSSFCTLDAGTKMDYVDKVHATRAQLEGSKRFVIVTATQSGVVSLWDGFTNQLTTTLDYNPYNSRNSSNGQLQLGRRISMLRVSPIQSETCPRCGELPLDSLCIALSVESTVKIFKAYICAPGSKRCSCSQNQPKSVIGVGLSGDAMNAGASKTSTGRLSRVPSQATLASVGNTMVSTPRGPIASAFQQSGDFPVSAHGVHSRKASEKDASSRRGSENLGLLIPPTEDNQQRMDGGSALTSPILRSSSAPWNAMVVEEHTDATCERGRWDVANIGVIGICRKPRTTHSESKSSLDVPHRHTMTSRSKQNSSSFKKPPSKEGSGLTNATMERWEMWIFDPAKSVFHRSPLIALTDQPASDQQASSIIPNNQGNGIANMNGNGNANPVSAKSSSSALHMPRAPVPQRLPFTRVSPLTVCRNGAYAGFGNTVGLMAFSEGC